MTLIGLAIPRIEACFYAMEARGRESIMVDTAHMYQILTPTSTPTLPQSVVQGE